MSASYTPTEVEGSHKEIVRLKREAKRKDKEINQLRAQVTMMRHHRERNTILKKKLKKCEVEARKEADRVNSLYMEALKNLGYYKRYFNCSYYAILWKRLLTRYKENNDREAIKKLTDRIDPPKDYLSDVAVRIMSETYGSNPLKWE